jgi:hypothetical protein
MYALFDRKGTAQRKSMAISSINFAKSSSGGLKHNDRTEEKEPEYLLPVEHRLENEVDISANMAEEKIKDLYTKAKENYQDKFGQKLQAKSYTWEALINLNKEHTLEDVQRLTKAIEKETGFTSVQIAVHGDEGHINERGIVQYNLHAHVTFFTLDQNTGQQLYRKSITQKQKEQQPNLKPMNRERLSKLQDITAKELNMERGKKGSKAIRLGHKQYKAVKQEELAKQKDLKAEIAELRAELQANKASRADYAELEALNKDLKKRIKSKDLTISDLKSELEAKISDFKPLDVEIPQKSDKNDLRAISDELDRTNETVPSDYELEEAQRFGAGFTIHRFIEDKGTKGERTEKVDWLHKLDIPTVTFDVKELEKLKENLNRVDKVQIGLARKALNAYNQVQRNLHKIKNFIKEKITPKKKFERTKNKSLNVEKKDRGISRG